MPEKIKIATMSAFGYPDTLVPGKYLFTHEQAKALSCIAQVDVFDLGADENLFKDITEETYENIKVYRFPKIIRSSYDIIIKIPALLRFRKEINKFISSNNYDLIILSFIDPRYLLFLYPFKNYKIALTAHGFDALIQFDNWFYRVIKKFMLKRVDLVLAVSDFTAELIKGAIDNNNQRKIKVVYNGINKQKLLPAKEIDREEIRKKIGIRAQYLILSICNLVERKGVDVAIKADRILKDKGYNFTHIIAGKGKLKKNLEQLVEKLDLGDNVYFIDSLTDQQIGSYYKAADVFVVISRSLFKQREVEGFGIVFAEAGFLGVPVVAGNSGGVPSVVKNKVTGFLIDTEAVNPEKETADDIVMLFTDGNLWKKMSENSRDYVSTHFDWNLNAQRIIELFKEVNQVN